MGYTRLVCALAMVTSLARGAQAQDGDPPQDGDSPQDGEGGAPVAADEAQAADQERVSALLDEEARGRFQLGSTLYRQGRFDDAAREFRAAYGLAHRPELLYNLYLVERDAGNTREAAEALRGFLRDTEEVPDRGLMEGRLAALDRQLARDQANDDDSGQPQADTQRGPVQAGSAATDPAVLGGGPEPPGPPDGPPSRVLPVVLMIAGAAGLLVGGGFALAAKGKYDDLDAACTGGVCLRRASQVDIDTLRRDGLVADISFAAGGASLVAGLLVWVLQGGADEDGRGVRAGCGLEGCGLHVRGSF